MKLSSISFLAAAIAAIAGSAAAAPTLHPMEQNSFERDVDIYSRAGFMYNDRHHRDHRKVSQEANDAMVDCVAATDHARKKGDEFLTAGHELDVAVLREIKKEHDKRAGIREKGRDKREGQIT